VLEEEGRKEANAVRRALIHDNSSGKKRVRWPNVAPETGATTRHDTTPPSRPRAGKHAGRWSTQRGLSVHDSFGSRWPGRRDRAAVSVLYTLCTAARARSRSTHPASSSPLRLALLRQTSLTDSNNTGHPDHAPPPPYRISFSALFCSAVRLVGKRTLYLTTKLPRPPAFRGMPRSG